MATTKSINLFKERCDKFGFKPEQILPHDSYLINPGHPEREALDKPRNAFVEEIERCMHLNDNKCELDSRKDRHHSLGQGEIGWNVFKYIMSDDRFNGVPMVLETIDETIRADEIEALKMMAT